MVTVWYNIRTIYPIRHTLYCWDKWPPTAQSLMRAVIFLRDAHRLLHVSSSSDRGSHDPVPHSLVTILDFVSFNAYDSFPDRLPTWSLLSEALSALLNFSLLAHPDPDRYLHAPCLQSS